MNLDIGATMTSHRLPTHTIISLRGELDIATTADLRERMLVLVGCGDSPVIVDLSLVTFCDASGLALLVGVQRRAQLSSISTCLAGPRPQVNKLLHLTGLDHAFTIYPSLASAVLGLSTPKQARLSLPIRIHGYARQP
jgi:anti-sigma B factor antagonist